jgi:hypothetical protein
MTQATSRSNTQSRLENLVKVAHERSARGNATADDWRSIAEIDEERARLELAEYLQTTTAGTNANPYSTNPRSVGTVAGFIAGGLIMMFMWRFGVPYLQDAWASFTYGPGFATAITYVSTVLLPLGAWAGSRWDRAHRPASAVSPTESDIDTDDTFEGLLQRFCRIQNRARTRVY